MNCIWSGGTLQARNTPLSCTPLVSVLITLDTFRQMHAYSLLKLMCLWCLITCSAMCINWPMMTELVLTNVVKTRCSAILRPDYIGYILVTIYSVSCAENNLWCVIYEGVEPNKLQAEDEPLRPHRLPQLCDGLSRRLTVCIRRQGEVQGSSSW